MIKIKYKALFNIGFPHAFYKSGGCSDIVVLPSADCNTLLRSLGLRFLPTEFGASLYGKVNETDVMNKPLPEGTKFTFLLRLRNSLFKNFTDLNLLKPATSIYYFNNLKSNPSGSESVLAADVATKVVSDTDLLPIRTNSFSFANSSTAVSQTGKLEFLDSGEVLDQTLENSNDLYNFSLDLNKATRGRARFLIDGLEKTTFLSLAADEVSDTFGVVEIFFKAGLPSENQFQDADNAIVSKNYSIPFANRSTKWRYVVTKKFNQSITGISVGKINGTAINFTTVAGPTPGRFIVTSNNKLPLTEEPIFGIKLTDENDKVLVASLPNPPLGLVKIEGNETFSDILITI